MRIRWRHPERKNRLSPGICQRQHHVNPCEITHDIDKQKRRHDKAEPYPTRFYIRNA